MSTILVTGAQGFVGRWVTAELLDRGHRVVGLGRSPPRTDRRSGVGRYRYVAADLCDPAAARRAVEESRPELAIHLAAALRDESWSDLVASNVTAGSNLLTAVAAAKAPVRLVYASSGSVYGAQERLPCAETAAPRPVGLYSASKLMGELAVQALAAHAGLPLCVARVFNLLGPELQPRHLAARLAREVAAIELGRRPPSIVTGPLGATRDFIDVRDVGRMLADLADAPRLRPLINVASGRETLVRELAQGLIARARMPIELVESRDAAAPVGADRQAGDTRLAQAHGLIPRIDLERSLDDMLAFARAAAQAERVAEAGRP